MLRTLFSPAIALVSKLRFAQKFILIACILAIPTLFMLTRIVINFNTDLSALNNERVGLQYANIMRDVVDQLQRHRGLTTAFLQGKTDFAPAITESEQKLKTAIDQVKKQLATTPLTPIPEKWQKLETEITPLLTQWQQSSDNFQQHSRVIAHSIALLGDIAHYSGLSLDPESDSYYLQDIYFANLMPATETLAKARGIGTRLATEKTATPEDAIQMSTLAVLTQQTAEQINKKLSRTSVEKLKAAGKTSGEQLNQTAQYLQTGFANTEIKVDPAAHFALLTRNIDALNQFSVQVIAEIETALTARENRIMAQRNFVLSLALIMLALGAYLLTGAYLSIHGSVNQLRLETELLASGDLSRTIHLNIKDELADVGESFNIMAISLRHLIGQIRQNANAVSNSADRLNQNSDQVVQASHHQANASSEMAAAMEQMSVSIATVSEHAASSELQAQAAQNDVQQGQTLMQSVLHEITDLSENLQDLGGKVDNMQVHSTEIGSIVQVIKEIADQTNLLALNAAIEAARAGEQGRGFAVVADEVRKLAERTSASTTEITKLVSTIRKDTDEAVKGMVIAREEMARGSERVGDASKALSNINSSSREELNAIAEINSAMAEQKLASHAIAQSVERIARLAEDNSLSADANAGLSLELKRSATQLDQLVTQFKL
ncbi:methyl-accepting chemotaxis protein [Deefgea salmonis]|uniref:Methyl-accepting chemotaxis protein n=1 Tax=Deefgea salmonis TaxID=2875502 RepID=A0ABS8BJC9_9NEIS|nr:methyl-accepting chemotaxis protein [Deefgea salmonis]MCB5195821.1 methyl-accepting chemotaxis protein [Deefgea salmonis]